VVHAKGIVLVEDMAGESFLERGLEKGHNSLPRGLNTVCTGVG